MLAHELRNPLAPMSNAVQVLRHRGGEPGAVRSATALLERQVGQMTRLVDDLLDMSRITRGKIELRRERTELAPVIHQAVEATRALYKSMNHELSVSLPAQPIFLDADPARLAQVIGNLLNNACKFTDKGGRIWLTVEQEGPQAVIRVRDTGVGIAAGDVPRLFEMFTQVDTSLERSRDGLGIGLTLVKTLVEMHGGSVEAHSEGIGRGSEFAVRLPALARTREPEAKAAALEPAPAAGRRILIVDDNDDGAESLAMLRALDGHETHTAHDGLEALEATDRLRPDVVLLDIGLPDMDGYEVARRLRNGPGGRSMALVAVSGYGQEDDRGRAREAGFDAHLTKPASADDIARLIDELAVRAT
jgi:CheY-like chemotaxis protein/two-component sensor histidine kinase